MKILLMERDQLGLFSPGMQGRIIDFLEMLASEPFAGSPSTTEEAQRLLLAIEQDQQMGW